jgi:glycosyltransferase involved in cell wall biosynthesis
MFFNNCDIYHFYNFICPSISKNKKVIITVYDVVNKRFPETMKESNRILLDRKLEESIRRADKIITISESTKADIKKYYGVEEAKIEVVYTGVDIDFFSKGKEAPVNIKNEVREKYKLPQKYFLYLGTIEPRKNIITIIKAYEALDERVRKEYKLVLAGGIGWKAEKIIEHISKSSCRDDIIMTGYVDEYDKPYIYSMASVFVFPSLYEGFGMPIVEAMASGTPVVTANNSSLLEAGGKGALYSDAMDYESIGGNIISIIENKKLNEKLIHDAFEHAKNFSWDKSAKETLEIYKKVLE